MKQLFIVGILLAGFVNLAAVGPAWCQDMVSWPLAQYATREQQAVYHQSLLDPRDVGQPQQTIQRVQYPGTTQGYHGYDQGLSQIGPLPEESYGPAGTFFDPFDGSSLADHAFAGQPPIYVPEGYREEKIYDWTFLPAGHIYKPYIAAVKESRMAVHLMKNSGDNWLLDGNLGGRFGVLRFGDDSEFLPEGFQWDVESSAHVRLDIPEDVDVRSVDFRAGSQFSWTYRQDPRHRTRFGYYHISSHLGDEFLIKNPGYNRLNFARDVLILGHSYYFTPRLRVYGQMGWAFYSKESDPWEFEFGVEFAPVAETGCMGEPFFAIHGHLRQEVGFGGNVVVQTGWAWVGEVPGRTLRTGLHYYNGKSSQYSFFDEFEQQIGYGIWYDF